MARALNASAVTVAGPGERRIEAVFESASEQGQLRNAGVMDDANRGGSPAAGVCDLALSGAPRRPFPAALLPSTACEGGELSTPAWSVRVQRLKKLVFDVEHATRVSWSMRWVDAWELGEIPSEINAPRQQVQQLTDGLIAGLGELSATTGGSSS